MKPVYNIEITLNEKNKNVYVYKIEQKIYAKKTIDIRNIVKDLFGKLYVRLN